MNEINAHIIDTPLGQMYSLATEEGICMLLFTDQPHADQRAKVLSKKLNAILIPRKTTFQEQLESELGEYFRGMRTEFEVPIHSIGSMFQKKVWESLLSIPYGQASSYKSQASKIDAEQAVRAVATANAQNPILILYPCHRIIGSDGQLKGYSGGLERKKYLLEMESGIQQLPLSL
ncbi:MAG: methylated-DNA--[protein]-cysteine S-methyltransferase [Cyclobacteriaceae bacterium]|nr:methylated-DNA--[protein]-cysteine S-methyltransferase [Cyclobacteriaceae bacterium]MCH8516775.1 methylated-DNA--[protein]-cysteine S-methyltransferase [Cyclobacteriaceae bacterium]